MPEIEISAERGNDPHSRRVGILLSLVSILLSVFTITSPRSHTVGVLGTLL